MLCVLSPPPLPAARAPASNVQLMVCHIASPGGYSNRAWDYKQLMKLYVVLTPLQIRTFPFVDDDR